MNYNRRENHTRRLSKVWM